jgi:integrase
VSRIRLHDLRHTYATIALRAGVHPAIVSERLGHSSIAVTIDLYSHAVPGLPREAAAGVVGDLIFGGGRGDDEANEGES